MANIIERSNQRGKFSIPELQAKVRESRAFWNSPEGRKAKANQEAEQRNRKQGGTRFPSAAKGKLIPSITVADEALILRFSK